MVQFDEHGHLFPHKIIAITVSEFETVFVNGVGDINHRKELFDRYLKFVEDLKSAFESPFTQWIDGSFITTKEQPGDIDVVTFLPYDTLTNKANAVHRFRESAKIMYFVDAAFCPLCKWNHRFYEKSKEMEAYWLNLYSHSRLDINKKRHPKGLIKIDFLP